MSDSGDTEWTVFLDAVVWHYVTRYVAESVTKPPIYAITSGATEAMNVTLADFDVGSKYLSSQGMEAMFHVSLHEIVRTCLRRSWRSKMVGCPVSCCDGKYHQWSHWKQQNWFGLC
mmetsp:Transcript_6856/g.10114  ORF Transcript_6856/g.10114 Transcript_6856/m.10114 type:complete len:116 (+) Transcript_6856:395-742(+)